MWPPPVGLRCTNMQRSSGGSASTKSRYDASHRDLRAAHSPSGDVRWCVLVRPRAQGLPLEPSASQCGRRRDAAPACAHQVRLRLGKRARQVHDVHVAHLRWDPRASARHVPSKLSMYIRGSNGSPAWTTNSTGGAVVPVGNFYSPISSGGLLGLRNSLLGIVAPKRCLKLLIRSGIEDGANGSVC
jgi:hypothetical protein